MKTLLTTASLSLSSLVFSTLSAQEPNIPKALSAIKDEVPAPESPTRRYDTSSSRATKKMDSGSVKITAGDMEMNGGNNTITITRDVVLVRDGATISCDKLLITGLKQEESSDTAPAFTKAIASGGTVEIKRRTPEGKLQYARAQRAEYNAVTKDIILSGGPPFLQDGESFVETKSKDARIIMWGNGKYEVDGDRSTIVIPVENGPKSPSGFGDLSR